MAADEGVGPVRRVRPNPHRERLDDPRFERINHLAQKIKERVWYRFAVDMLAPSAERVVLNLEHSGIRGAGQCEAGHVAFVLRRGVRRDKETGNL